MSRDPTLVSVSINGETVEIERDAWDVLMRAFNQFVDTGDVAGVSAAALAKARMASGALYLIARDDPLNSPAAMRVRARRLQQRAQHAGTPAPAQVIRALLPVLGVSDNAMRPTLVPTPSRKPKNS